MKEITLYFLRARTLLIVNSEEKRLENSSVTRIQTTGQDLHLMIVRSLTSECLSKVPAAHFIVQSDPILRLLTFISGFLR